MGDHHRFGRPSLLLAGHDIAHREHIRDHTHQHHLLHQHARGLDAGVVGAIVTEVVATVSVIQQVTIDTNGITLGLNTYTADSTGGTSFPPTTTENATPYNTLSASPPGSSSLGSTASSTAASGQGDQTANNAAVSSSRSLLSIQDITTASAATPSSIPTTFASMLANSTSLISVSSTTSLTQSSANSSSFPSTISGSSFSSPSSSSVTLLLSSSTISDESPSPSLSSTSSLYSPNSSSPTATSTNGIIGGGGGTGTGSGDPSASTPAAGGGDGGSSGPSTSTVVGGVVGGVAGAAILIFLIMFLIRWKRRNSSMLALGNGEGEDATDNSRGVPPSQPPGGMAERSSFSGLVVPAALASLTGYKRSSQATADRNTMSSTAGSERGFYRVSGRKLPSVLQNGGDGYGGGINESNTLSGSSFYRDSQGFYGGVGGPASPGLATTRESGVPIMREGPARTPVREQSPFADPPVSLPPPRRPDVVGRSHPSLDGSQRSRFTEEV